MILKGLEAVLVPFHLKPAFPTGLFKAETKASNACKKLPKCEHGSIFRFLHVHLLKEDGGLVFVVAEIQLRSFKDIVAIMVVGKEVAHDSVLVERLVRCLCWPEPVDDFPNVSHKSTLSQ